MSTKTKSYIGDKEILMVSEITGETTPMGNPIVMVVFTDDSTKKYPKFLFEHLQTSEPIDATKLREKWVDPIANQVIVLMQESDIRMDDIAYLMDTVAQSIDHKSSTALAKLFEVDFYGQRSLLQIEKVIKPKLDATTEEGK